MLVLSRKLGESIRIADQIVVKIVQIRGGRVRLGIQAPESVRIRRDELGDDAEFSEPLDVEREEFPSTVELDLATTPSVAC